MGARWGGGGGFNNQTGPILVHIYPPFNNNLHVKYRSNLIRTFWVKIKNMKKIYFIFFGVMLGPYIKSRGTRGTKMSANADLITVETYVQQGETIWKPFFFHLWAKMYKKCIFWGCFGSPEGSSMIRLNLSCFPAILSPISMYMWNKEAIWDIFKFKPKIWQK